MQFVYIKDNFTGIEHAYLIMSLGEEEFTKVKALFESMKMIPSVSFSAILYEGRPWLVADYRFFESMKMKIPLDLPFISGETLGDILKVGDVVTFIFTGKPENEVIDLSKKEIFGVELNEMIASTVTYTVEMQEVYALYNFYQRFKNNKSKRKAKAT